MCHLCRKVENLKDVDSKLLRPVKFLITKLHKNIEPHLGDLWTRRYIDTKRLKDSLVSVNKTLRSDILRELIEELEDDLVHIQKQIDDHEVDQQTKGTDEYHDKQLSIDYGSDGRMKNGRVQNINPQDYPADRYKTRGKKSYIERQVDRWRPRERSATRKIYTDSIAPQDSVTEREWSSSKYPAGKAEFQENRAVDRWKVNRRNTRTAKEKASENQELFELASDIDPPLPIIQQSTRLADKWMDKCDIAVEEDSDTDKISIVSFIGGEDRERPNLDIPAWRRRSEKRRRRANRQDHETIAGSRYFSTSPSATQTTPASRTAPATRTATATHTTPATYSTSQSQFDANLLSDIIKHQPRARNNSKMLRSIVTHVKAHAIAYKHDIPFEEAFVLVKESSSKKDMPKVVLKSKRGTLKKAFSMRTKYKTPDPEPEVKPAPRLNFDTAWNNVSVTPTDVRVAMAEAKARKGHAIDEYESSSTTRSSEITEMSSRASPINMGSITNRFSSRATSEASTLGSNITRLADGSIKIDIPRSTMPATPDQDRLQREDETYNSLHNLPSYTNRTAAAQGSSFRVSTPQPLESTYKRKSMPLPANSPTPLPISFKRKSAFNLDVPGPPPSQLPPTPPRRGRFIPPSETGTTMASEATDILLDEMGTSPKKGSPAREMDFSKNRERRRAERVSVVPERPTGEGYSAFVSRARRGSGVGGDVPAHHLAVKRNGDILPGSMRYAAWR